MITKSPYKMSFLPKGSWELIRWGIFEPRRVDRYANILKKRYAVKKFLKCYILIMIVSIFIWLATGMIWSVFDVPRLFRQDFTAEFMDSWQSVPGFMDKFTIYIFQSYRDLLFSLAFGLAGGLAVGLAVGLAGGLGVGLGVGLAGVYFGPSSPTYFGGTSPICFGASSPIWELCVRR